MKRSFSPEILDDPNVPNEVAERAYRDLTRVHRWLGNTAAILRAIQQDPLPLRRVLDLGCARGDMLLEIRQRMGVDIVGVDLRLPRVPAVPMIEADAVRDTLPHADIAICVCVAHHLSEDDLIALIRNAGRSCRRLILLDLVRHWIPLWLYSIFIAPFIDRVTAADGRLSVRRAYTPDELASVVRRALAGSPATFRQTVTPFYTRQLIDISFQ